MFIKYSSIQLKGSASICTNNLSVLFSPKEKSCLYAVVGKNCVYHVKNLIYKYTFLSIKINNFLLFCIYIFILIFIDYNSQIRE